MEWIERNKSLIWLIAVLAFVAMYVWYLYESIKTNKAIRQNLTIEHNDIKHYHKHDYFFEQGTQNIINPKDKETIELETETTINQNKQHD